MLKQIAEVMVQRACRHLITVVATAAVSVDSPLFVRVAWLRSAGGSGAISGWCWMHPSWAVRREGQPIPMQASQPTPQHPTQQGMTACQQRTDDHWIDGYGGRDHHK